MIVLSPVVEAYTTARSLSMARIRAIAVCCSVSPSCPSISKSASLDCRASRFAPAVDLGPHQVVEAHLVADHVAEPDLARSGRRRPGGRG